MAYNPMTHVNHMPEHPGRIRLIPVPGEDGLYDVIPEEGDPVIQGTAVGETELNHMETGIADAHTAIDARTITVIQVEEPQNPTPETIWFAVGAETDFSVGGGVNIGNATTSDSPPETTYWFNTINS